MAITKALRRAPAGGYEVGPPKTAGSVRTVRVGREAVAALRAHQTRQKVERLAAGKRWRAEGLVFTTPVGTHLDPSKLGREWRALCNKAGVKAVFHEARHTVGSHAVEDGVPLATVADQLGHSSIEMLARTYRHRIASVVDVSATTEALISPRE